MTPNISEFLPEAMARRHEAKFRTCVDLLQKVVKAHAEDHTLAHAINEQLKMVLEIDYVRLNLTREPSLIMHLDKLRIFELQLSRGWAGVPQIQTQLANSCDRYLGKSVPVSRWADDYKREAIDHNLAKIACHLDRNNEVLEHHIMADKMAVLTLAAAMEKPLSGLSQRQIIALAEKRLSQQSDPLSNRALQGLGLYAAGRLIIRDQEKDVRDDQILITCDLPESARQSFLDKRNVPLETIVSIDGLEAMGVTATSIHEGVGMDDYDVHTDLWNKRNLIVLKAKSKVSKRLRQ